MNQKELSILEECKDRISRLSFPRLDINENGYFAKLSTLVLGMTICIFLLLPPSKAYAEAPGDLNGDDDITSVDAAIVLQILEGRVTPTSEQLRNADGDRDGQVTRTDAEMILYWAAQGFGINPPSFFTDIIELPVLSSNTATIGDQGGEISLSSGVTLSIPAGRMKNEVEITLSQVDPSEIDSLGNKTCFRISPDVSYEKGSKLTVPYISFLRQGEAVNDMEGLAIVFYNPWTRKYEMNVVDYALSDSALSIMLSQIRTGQFGSPTPEAELLVFVVGKSFLESATSSIHPSSTAPALIRKMEIPNVPFYEQGKYGYCWAANSVMLVNFYARRLGEKPWHPAKYLEIDEKESLSNIFSWLGIFNHYKNYMHMATGFWPEVILWFLENSLKEYFTRQIDAGHPVHITLPYKSHGIVIVGYETNQQGTIANVIYHDPAYFMYVNEAFHNVIRFKDKDGRFKAVYTYVMPGIVNDWEGININILGHHDLGLIFSPPTWHMVGNIYFAWYVKNIKKEGYLTNGEQVIQSIPNYYSMELYLRLINSSKASKNVKIKCYLTPLSQGDNPILIAEREIQVPVHRNLKRIRHKEFDIKLKQENLRELDGNYLLNVIASDPAGDQEYDVIQLPISFNHGIEISAERKPDPQNPDKTIVKLTWNEINGVFDGYYQVFKKTGYSFQKLPNGKVTPPSPCQAFDNDFQQDTSYIVVAMMKDGTKYLTSDVVSVRQCPYLDVLLTLEWSDTRANLGISATNGREYLDLGYGHISPLASVSPRETGDYEVHVWIHSVTGDDPLSDVPFVLTIKRLRYDIEEPDNKVVFCTAPISETVNGNASFTKKLVTTVTAKHPDE